MDNYQAAAYAQLAIKQMLEKGYIKVDSGFTGNIYSKMQGCVLNACDMYTESEAEEKIKNL